MARAYVIFGINEKCHIVTSNSKINERIVCSDIKEVFLVRKNTACIEAT
jgi:hypothetical protein